MSPGSTVRRATVGDIADVLLNTKRPRPALIRNHFQPGGHCFACDRRSHFQFLNIINDELAEQWQLTPSLRRGFDLRESSKCQRCGSSLRSRLHARAICRLLAPGARSLAQAIKNKQFAKQRIAEINACGALHKILATIPNLHYSEYRPDDKATRHEDLHALSYQPNYFDAVLTSETLEHLPDWRRAKREIHRVLKPGGHHIFTTPAILNRQTRVRAKLGNGKVTKLLPASYHGYNRGSTEDYLVFNEFGADLRRAIDELGFSTKIYYRNLFYLSDPNLVFVSTKTG